MAGGGEKLQATTRDGLGPAVPMDCGANKGRVALSPLDPFGMQQRNRRQPPLEICFQYLRNSCCLFAHKTKKC
ncbi:unnamed protein product [Urochloa humidicola]